jgi:hypothetical protein
MQVVAVRGKLDETRGLHLARLGPGHEVAARHDAIAVQHRAVERALHPAAEQRRHDREAIDLQQRVDMGVEAAIAVVEGDEDRLVGQRPRPARRGGDIVERDRRPARAFQPVEELRQDARGDRVGIELIGAVGHVVEGDGDETLPGRLGVGRAGEQHEEYGKPAHHIL